MGRISIGNVAAAVSKVGAMSSSQQVALIDEITKTQPNLLALCLAQKALGVRNGGLEHTLKMLLTCYQAMKETGLSWPVISEVEQERHMEHMVTTISFAKGFRSQKLSNRTTRKFFDAIPEQPLLSYVLGESRSWLQQIAERETEAETDKFPVMASLNIVNCIAHAMLLT